MKKVLSVLTILLLSFVLYACETPPADGAEAKLQQAHDSLATVISDPSNITNSFQVPTTLANGVTATWTSSQTSVIAFGSPASGLASATVTRPAFGADDAVVTITAVLSLQSEVSDDIITKNWSLQLTVKANTVAPIVIETISDVLELTDGAYDGGTYQVTIPNITIFAKADVAFGYDGTGIIQLFNSQTNFEVGKVYNITGALEWYFGIWELVQSLGTEVTSATPQYPTKETISSVTTKINALIASGEHQYANVPDGNFEPIYATVTGTVYMIPEDTSNYNTFLIDTEATAFVPGTSTVPANGFMFYYNTHDLAYVRSFEGFDVTMDVIIYTYRSNNLAFAVYYLGGPAGISANLTDEEAVAVTKAALELPVEVTETDTVLSLPTTSSTGTTIVWSYKNEANPDNNKINLTTGAVTLPAAGTQVEVVLVATITKGEETDTKEFAVKIGELPVSTVEDVYAAVNGTKLRVQVTVLGYNGNNQISIADETGAVTVFGADVAASLAALAGKKIDLIGTRGAFNGLIQLTAVTFTEIGASTLPTPTDLSTIELWNATTLLPYQSGLVSATNLKVTARSLSGSDNLSMTFLDELTGNTIGFFLHNLQPIDNKAFILGLQVGDYVSFTGALLTWSNAPQIAINAASQATAGVAPTLTDDSRATVDRNALTLPTVATEDLTLPTAGSVHESVITWASSHPEIIANDGTFVAPETDAQVTLTATITKGEAVLTKEFVIDAKAPVEGEGTLMIYELYGGGGNAGATYTHDYVVLYNGTFSDIDLSTYSLQYGAAAFGSGYNGVNPLSGTIGAGEFFLIQLAGGATGIALPVTPDLVISASVINLAGAAGNIALFSKTTAHGTASLEGEATLVDRVGFGTSAASTPHEGTGRAPAPSNTTSIRRKTTTDTNDNAADFEVITLTANSLDYLTA